MTQIISKQEIAIFFIAGFSIAALSDILSDRISEKLKGNDILRVPSTLIGFCASAALIGAPTYFALKNFNSINPLQETFK